MKARIAISEAVWRSEACEGMRVAWSGGSDWSRSQEWRHPDEGLTPPPPPPAHPAPLMANEVSCPIIVGGSSLLPPLHSLARTERAI